MDSKRIGRYQILGEIERGAVGSLLRASDPLNGRIVMIKTLPAAMLAGDQDGAFRDRFYCEARAAEALSTPGIVPVFDVGEDNGVPFLVMELVEGLTLDAMMGQGERYSLGRVCEIGRQIADALGYAHRMGVVHGDIKPANILMTSRKMYGVERPRITGFCIANLPEGEMTSTGHHLEAAAFRAPEQHAKARIDGRADLFSLGAILYWMMTGERPFIGETLTEVLHNVEHAKPIVPSKLNTAVPPQLELIVLRCLAKKPADRYTTGEELATHLAIVQMGSLGYVSHEATSQTMPVKNSGQGETVDQTPNLPPKAARIFAGSVPGHTSMTETMPAMESEAGATFDQVPSQLFKAMQAFTGPEPAHKTIRETMPAMESEAGATLDQVPSHLFKAMHAFAELEPEHTTMQSAPAKAATHNLSPGPQTEPVHRLRVVPRPSPLPAEQTLAPNVLRDTVVSQLRSTLAEKASTQSRRKRGVLMLVGAAFVSVVVVAASLLLHTRTTETPQQAPVQQDASIPTQTAVVPPTAQRPLMLERSSVPNPSTQATPVLMSSNEEEAVNPTRVPATMMNDQLTAPARIPRDIRTQSADDVPPPASIGTASAEGLGGSGAIGSVFNGQARPIVKAAPSKPIAISAGIMVGMLTRKTIPIYPVIAKSAHMSGTVVLDATISKAGAIKDLHVVSGPPMLRQAAVDAVQNWRYKPYMLNNEPTEVQTTINVIFSFGQ